LNPEIGRISFNISVLILLLSIFSLTVVKKDSAEFIVDIIVMIIVITFTVIVAYDIRRQVKKEERNKK
jgi:Ca2+/Na+ antiporter